MEDPYEENNRTDSYGETPPAIPVTPSEDGYNTINDDLPPLKPSNWLWQSIVATVLCCIPFGVVGIVYAARVDSLYYNKRYDEAEASARKAKTWTLIAVGAGLLYLVVWMVLMFTGNVPGYLENIIENNASGYNF